MATCLKNDNFVVVSREKLAALNRRPEKTKSMEAVLVLGLGAAI